MEVRMQQPTEIDSTRTIRIFNTPAKQDQETIRFWRTQTFADRMQAIDEMAQYFASQHGIDTDAQGPKRVTRRFQRTWG
jgi:hypothetical protein